MFFLEQLLQLVTARLELVSKMKQAEILDTGPPEPKDCQHIWYLKEVPGKSVKTASQELQLESKSKIMLDLWWNKAFSVSHLHHLSRFHVVPVWPTRDVEPWDLAAARCARTGWTVWCKKPRPTPQRRELPLFLTKKGRLFGEHLNKV